MQARRKQVFFVSYSTDSSVNYSTVVPAHTMKAYGGEGVLEF